MWSKILILTMAVLFMAAVGTGVLAHDGRIPNIIEDPDDGDEHPWGGENELVDDPVLVAAPTYDPFFYDSQFLFIRLSLQGTWLSIKNVWLDYLESRSSVVDVKGDATALPMPIENEAINTNQGTGNK